MMPTAIRVSKTVGGVTTLFLVDVQNLTGYSQVLEELGVSAGATNLARVYGYGLDLISQRHADGAIQFYGFDGNGSVRFLTGANGAISDTYAYDAYGLLIDSLGTIYNVYLFAAEEFDIHTQLYYLTARYLNAGTGRFWTSDTFEGNHNEPLSLHKYLYAHADPVNYADPSGFERISVTTGYAVTGAGQHIVPFTTWDEIRFNEEAMEFLDQGEALLPAPDHDATKHPRYTHEIRAEWERFLDSPAGKKYRSKRVFGRDAAQAFVKHIKTAGNRYIDGFNSAVGGGPDAINKWYQKTGKHIPISTLKTSIWKNAAKRLGKRIPYVNFLLAGVSYQSALASARAAHDREAVAQLEALAEALNPLPFSQQDIRDVQARGKRFWTNRQTTYELRRFGDLLD